MTLLNSAEMEKTRLNAVSADEMGPQHFYLEFQCLHSSFYSITIMIGVIIP